MEVALAQARYEVAEREIGVKDKSAFQPNLYTGSGAAYTYGFPLTPGGAAPSIINFSYVQALFNPVQTAQLRAAEERKEIQRLELEKTRNTVAFKRVLPSRTWQGTSFFRPDAESAAKQHANSQFHSTARERRLRTAD